MSQHIETKIFNSNFTLLLRTFKNIKIQLCGVNYLVDYLPNCVMNRRPTSTRLIFVLKSCSYSQRWIQLTPRSAIYSFRIGSNFSLSTAIRDAGSPPDSSHLFSPLRICMYCTATTLLTATFYNSTSLLWLPPFTIGDLAHTLRFGWSVLRQFMFFIASAAYVPLYFDILAPWSLVVSTLFRCFGSSACQLWSFFCSSALSCFGASTLWSLGNSASHISTLQHFGFLAPPRAWHFRKHFGISALSWFVSSTLGRLGYFSPWSLRVLISLTSLAWSLWCLGTLAFLHLEDWTVDFRF